MLLEPHWINAFQQVLQRCAALPGDTMAILVEIQSRADLSELARHAWACADVKNFMLTSHD